MKIKNLASLLLITLLSCTKEAPSPRQLILGNWELTQFDRTQYIPGAPPEQLNFIVIERLNFTNDGCVDQLLFIPPVRRLKYLLQEDPSVIALSTPSLIRFSGTQIYELKEITPASMKWVVERPIADSTGTVIPGYILEERTYTKLAD